MEQASVSEDGPLSQHETTVFAQSGSGKPNRGKIENVRYWLTSKMWRQAVTTSLLLTHSNTLLENKGILSPISTHELSRSRPRPSVALPPSSPYRCWPILPMNHAHILLPLLLLLCIWAWRAAQFWVPCCFKWHLTLFFTDEKIRRLYDLNTREVKKRRAEKSNLGRKQRNSTFPIWYEVSPHFLSLCTTFSCCGWGTMLRERSTYHYIKPMFAVL